MSKSYTQAECDEINALHEYERIHARHMRTSVWDACRPELNRELEVARKTYISAVEAVHPTWIVC